MKPRDIVELAKEKRAQFVDLKFIDLFGSWQHTTLPISRLEESSFEEGFGFDGSSIRGWQPIHASDMLMIPDPSSARMDPFPSHKTMSLVCSVLDPVTKQPYPRDPRHIARKAEAHLRTTGIADTCFLGPEAEFFVFDSIRYETSPNASFFEIDSEEAIWNSGKEGFNLGYRTRNKEGYFPVPPTDKLVDLRDEIMLALQAANIEVEVGHHEVGAAGQCEIDIKYASLVESADQLMWLKYVVKNIAHKFGKTATFMPKPLFGDNGSGMHCHLSLWKEGSPLFSGDGYAGISDLALFSIGGVIKHAPALAALTNPATNSYRRLVPGFEAPVNLAYSSRNRSASIRIPIAGASSPKARRIEIRFPDATCNPYLAFAALLMAAIDGIRNRIDPGPPLDKDIYALSPEEAAEVPKMPGSLDEALDALERDHEFLLVGDVFTPDVIKTWIDYKRRRELDALRKQPVPYEFYLYYDA